MKEIFATQNPAEIALLKSLFQSADIQAFFFDEQASSAMGGMGGWTPCRVMVSNDAYADALALLKEAGVI